MARPQVDHAKWMAVSKLNMGDKVRIDSGEVAEFVRLKSKDFIGIIGGSEYSIFVNSFVEVIEEAEKHDNKSVLDSLKTGDYFYIDKNGDALLFIFDSIVGNKVIGINPITKSNVRIDGSFNFYKVDSK